MIGLSFFTPWFSDFLLWCNRQVSSEGEMARCVVSGQEDEVLDRDGGRGICTKAIEAVCP